MAGQKQKSKGDINRLGDAIRCNIKSIDPVHLQELQEYRTSHKESLSYVFHVLCKATRQIQPSSISTYRLKRFESIIGKLSRYPKMELSRMWDIAGCRCIMRNDKAVYDLYEHIAKELEIKKTYDYIKEPQKEGYKSLHVFVSIPNDTKVIEVQIRSLKDHNWATLVEITDVLFDAKLKEYGENKDFLRFHYLLSRVGSLSIHDKYEISKTIKKYNYFGKLSEVFTRNYIQVRKQWNQIENNKTHKYFLIESTKEEVPKIASFSNYLDAENRYFEIFKNSHHANVVLTHLNHANYRQISIAYSNYILTFHTFLHECHEILISLIVEALEKCKYRAFLSTYNLYSDLVYNHIQNLAEEVVEIQSIPKRVKGKKSKDYKKEKEWVENILKEFDLSKQRSIALQKSIREHVPKIWYKKFVFRKLEQNVTRRYRKRVKMLLKKLGIKE